MPRNNAGTYTLPNPPVVSGTTIEAPWANSSLDDIKTELTNSLDRFGRGGMEAPFEFADGTETLPSMTFVNDTSTGFYRPSSSRVEVTVGGVGVAKFSPTNQLNVYRDLGWRAVLDDYTDQTITGAITFEGVVDFPNGITMTDNLVVNGSITNTPAANNLMSKMTPGTVSAFGDTTNDELSLFILGHHDGTEYISVFEFYQSTSATGNDLFISANDPTDGSFKSYILQYDQTRDTLVLPLDCDHGSATTVDAYYSQALFLGTQDTSTSAPGSVIFNRGIDVAGYDSRLWNSKLLFGEDSGATTFDQLWEVDGNATDLTISSTAPVVTLTNPAAFVDTTATLHVDTNVEASLTSYDASGDARSVGQLTAKPNIATTSTTIIASNVGDTIICETSGITIDFGTALSAVTGGWVQVLNTSSGAIDLDSIQGVQMYLLNGATTPTGAITYSIPSGGCATIYIKNSTTALIYGLGLFY